MPTYDKSAGPQDLFTITLEAAATINPRSLVELVTATQYTCQECATNNSKNVLGVCVKTSAVAAGNPCPIRVHGTVEVVSASANIYANDFLYSNATTVETIGAAIPAGSFHIVGRALSGTQTKGDYIKMLLLTIPGANAS